MKKYRVENAVRKTNDEENYNPKMKDCYVGDYITAENEKEAIEVALACIAEEIRHTTDYEVEADYENETVTVVIDDNENEIHKEVYEFFEATEIEEREE